MTTSAKRSAARSAEADLKALEIAARRALIVEALADQWREIEGSEQNLDRAKKRIRKQVLRLAEKHGEIASGAKSMRELRGLAYAFQCSYPESVEVDQLLAKQFMRRAPRSVAAKVFQRVERIVLRKDGFAIGADQLSGKNLELLAKSLSRENLSPRVKVVKRKRVSQKPKHE